MFAVTHKSQTPLFYSRTRRLFLRASSSVFALNIRVFSNAPAHFRRSTFTAAKIDPTEKGLRSRPPVLEEVDAVLGLDVHALLAQQDGAIQALSAQLKAQAAQLEAVAKQNAVLTKEVVDKAMVSMKRMGMSPVVLVYRITIAWILRSSLPCSCRRLVAVLGSSWQRNEVA